MKSLTCIACLLLPTLLLAGDPVAAQTAEEAVPANQTTSAFVEALKPDPVKPQAAAPAPRTRGMGSTATAQSVAATASAPKSADLAVYFGFNSDRITGASIQRVDNLAAALKDPKLVDGRFTVVGHTDAVGTREFNQRLSQQRAEAVRDYLVEHGVPAERLRAVGKGYEQLKNSDDPQADENRRVEIVAEY